MDKSEFLHPFRKPISGSSGSMKGLSSQPTEKQRNQKRVRDRIEHILEEREFKELWGDE